jgi:hypothetical protein
MSYSASDFTDEVFSLLVDKGLIKLEDLDNDDGCLPKNAELAINALEKALAKPTVVATIEGGVLQHVTACRDLDFVLVDHDTQGCTGEELRYVDDPSEDEPEGNQACVDVQMVEVNVTLAEALLAVAHGPTVAQTIEALTPPKEG